MLLTIMYVLTIPVHVMVSMVVAGGLRSSLELEILTILKSTYAEATKASYKTHLKSYASFCTVLGVPLVPAKPHVVALYAVLLARTLQYGSIPQYLNIVSLLHKSHALESPLNSFIVKSTLRGIRNSIGHEPLIKLPVTPVLLYKILNNMELDVLLDACVWMTCMVMFYGLLRKSNVVGVHRILRQDCKFVEDSVQLTIRSSKTRNKKTDIPRKLTLPRLKNHQLCPVAAIVNYLRLSAHFPVSSPLCSIQSVAGKYSILPYKQIVDAVRKVVPTDQSQSYATHSFRRGGASFMYSIGMSVESIRLMGDWKSLCYQRYITVDSGELSHKSVLFMQQNLPPPLTPPISSTPLRARYLMFEMCLTCLAYRHLVK